LKHVQQKQKNSEGLPVTCTIHIKSVVYNHTSATHDIDKANLFNKYFYSVFSHSPYSLPDYEDMPSTTTISLDSISICEEEVYDALSSLDPHKATGIDGFSPTILKHCAIVLAKPLNYLFSFALQYSILPSEWQIYCITPIFKSGDKNCVNNYRPIS